MARDFKFYCRRGTLLCIEAFAVIAVLLALMAGGLVWRLRSGPLDVEFAKDYIQEVLRNPERGTYATIDQVVLHWPDLRGPLLLGLRNVKVIGPEDHVIVSVDEAAFSLSKSHLMIGRISLVALILKKPALNIVRTVDGNIDIGFGPQGESDSEETVSPTKGQTAFTTRILEYIAQPGVEDDEDTPLATLQAFRVENAQVTLEDRAMNAFWFFPRLDVFFKSATEGLLAEFYTEFPDEQGVDSHVKGLVVFDWETRDSGVQAELVNFNPRFLAGKVPQFEDLKNQDIVLNARLEARFDPDLNPKEGNVQVFSASGAVMHPDLSPQPVPYKNLSVQASYDGQKKILDISQAQVTAKDVTVKAQASLTHGENLVQGPLKIEIDEARQESLGPLWPHVLKDDNSRVWIVDRLADGIFHDSYATMDVEMKHEEGQGWSFDANNILAGFSFDGMSIDYRAPLMPVTKARGSGIFDNGQEKLSVTIESAAIGDLQVTEAQLEFDNIIAKGAGVADINVKLTGPFRTALAYVSDEPIALDHGFDLSRVEGRADLNVNVGFPTVRDVKIEDVKVGVSGTLNDIVLPDVVRGLSLTDGPYSVSVKGNDFRVAGTGKLAGRAVRVEYKEFLKSAGQPYSSVVKASLIADPGLRDHFGIDLREFLEGAVPVDVTYTEYDGGRAEALVKADLKPAKLFVDPFDYEKMPGIEGTASLRAKLQNGLLQEVNDLTAVAPNFTLEDTQLFFRQRGEDTILSQGKASRFTIDETVGMLEFEVMDSGLTKIALEAPFLDLRPFMDDEGEGKVYDNPPMLISVNADRMRTHEGETVQYGKLYADIDEKGSFNQLEMDAIAGAGDVYLRYKPDESGKRVFRFEADDAGAALKAFGVYEKIRGGRMIIYGEPIRGVYDRNLLGVAEISDFKVVKAPALAKLLGAMSLPGLMSALNEEGIAFTKLEARFNWLYRPRGALLVLKDGRTSGNSLGLTFDGTFDKAKSTVDVSGTLVPLSGINKIIGSIPLVGEILTGGSGGVFAATYTVKGQAEEPEILVNPLSVLAPGILRRILFE